MYYNNIFNLLDCQTLFRMYNNQQVFLTFLMIILFLIIQIFNYRLQYPQL